MAREREPFPRRVVKAAFIVVVLPFILPLALLAFAIHLLYRGVLYLLVWALWLPRGKDILFVHSDSPIWREYMETQVLPLVQKRAVMLNWSERKEWPKGSLGPAVFRHFGGVREFNPLVILFRPLRPAKVFRFWSAFKDWKRGYAEPVERLRQEITAVL